MCAGVASTSCHTAGCITSCLSLFRETYKEKYTILQSVADTLLNGSVDYDSASFDFDGDSMHVLPAPNTVTNASFCVAPGEYVIHAVDGADDGWWGGAYYSVLIDGALVIHEEMGRQSSSKQSAAFSVALSPSARTVFSENKAPRGGGGFVFWEDVPPNNIENYRNTSDSNEAAYGDYAATPIRTLSAGRSSYDAVSGAAMRTDPITLDLKDGRDEQMPFSLHVLCLSF